MKNQKGITLVALVITIIVLLILAGVSISLVVGNNGVLTQASSSVITNNVAAVKEDLTMALAACDTKYYTEWASDPATTRKDVYEGEVKDPVVNTDGAFIDELKNKYDVMISTSEPNDATLKGYPADEEWDADNVADNVLVSDNTAYIVLRNSTTKEVYCFEISGVSEDTGSYTLDSEVRYVANGKNVEKVNV